ncbi:protein tyrosine kinase [Fragilaria crotonensis]|nr:protein tyrosine kinase [Fragilaria crotonensis]
MSIKHLHIEEIMRPTKHEEPSGPHSSSERRQPTIPSSDGRAPLLPYTVPASSLPPGVQQGLLLPPQTRRLSDTDVVKRSQLARSNLAALLESRGTNVGDGELTTSDQVDCDSSKDNEADSASGPSRPSPPEIGNLSRSAPLGPGIGVRRLPPPPDLFPPSYSPSRGALSSSIGKAEMRGERLKGNYHIQPPSQVRRCISSKELGYSRSAGSPYSAVLHQRELVQATLQRRLMDARRSSLSNERMMNTSSGTQESSDSSDSSKRGAQNQLNNETRNRRRAEHTKAVTNDLCEIVTDLFISEAKLLKPSSYGFDTSSQRDQVLKHVAEFVSSLPPRYALGVDTPSEVLLHMRLVAAARMDHSRTVVHVTNIKGDQAPSPGPSVQLVTISCVDALGLLEYITRILGTGGSRVIDADVMLNTDNIVLDRFVVEMKGRLRLDKLAQSIELFLANSQQRSPKSDEASGSHALLKSSSSSNMSLQGQPPGPLYFHAPVHHEEVSQTQLQQEIDSAVPLTEVLIASSSSANLVPMRRSSLERSNTMPTSLMQPVLPTPESSVSSGFHEIGQHVSQSQSTERRRRKLVSREASNFLQDPNADDENQSMAYLATPAQSSSGFEHASEDRVVPLIPFEELMLIETLGMGRVSTIYRAAWQKRKTDGEASLLTGVKMVALKVATINQVTGDTLHVDELRREADIAAMLNHPNICDLVGVAADSECFCLAYEYCEGGSLLSLMSDTARYYEYLPLALDIANGMAYLHSRQVIHRDLKPSNVLLTRDRRAKISDFGMSVANQGQELTAETGTYRYMAPEVIRHESYSSNADVYSFGILLWQLITREVPFSTMTPIQAAFSVAQGRRPEIPTSTPPRLREIISACWDQDAHMRPSFIYIAMALADYARLAFSPANVGAQTLQIANEMLATVEGNSTINVDFTTVTQEFEWSQMNSANGDGDVGLEIE